MRVRAREPDTIMSSKDWAKIKNKETGDVYYFNSATGETSWDKPAVRAERSIPLASQQGLSACLCVLIAALR